ncbi:hypothetical protein [Streptomyces pilosus]|uniref:hypothetical protein n=1 Tax=Streptomyces pilosus TaxID=28893 RepID=UPI00362D6578
MSTDTITSIDPGSPNNPAATLSDSVGGGAGRGGSGNTQQGPLVVVQQPRNASPPRPAHSANQSNTDNSLRNGYAAISHSVSGETAAIGIGFLVAGPVGAIVGGAALPVLAAASMWRARRREHDQNSNSGSDNSTGSGSGSASGGGRSGSGSGTGGGRGNGGGRNNSGSGGGGRHRTPKGPDGGRHKTPKTPGSGKGGLGNGSGGGGKNRKPKVKDPVADKLAKTGKGLANKLRNRTKNNDPKKPGKVNKAKPSTDTPDKTSRNKQPKARKDHSGAYPDDRRWRGRGHKDKTPEARTDKQRQGRKHGKGGKGGDTTTSTARDGLAPITPNNGSSTYDEVIDAEIVDDGLPPKPDHAPDDVIDGEVVDEDRIALVKARREKQRRRQAIEAAKRAEKNAARDGTQGDPQRVRIERLRFENQRIDHELARHDHLLALAAGTEQRRSTPVNYPVATTTPGSHTPGVAVARQIDTRGTIAYRLLLDLAEQLAGGLHNDADADMADHVTELAALPNLCRDLAAAVTAGANALSKTAPLHPSVVKHLNAAAISAVTAAKMADTIMAVFVQAHREDIFRVMQPRIGEDRWNIRNAAGTLDAAKLRAAILSSGQQRALPAGTSSTGGALVPASDAHTKKLVTLMKGFDRGHMVTCLSEVAGTAAGVEIVADSVTKLYRRMVNTWPTEDAVDDTVLATASKVKNISAELRKAIKAAQRAHQRDLKLNAKPRKGAAAESKWDTVRGRQG